MHPTKSREAKMHHKDVGSNVPPHEKIITTRSLGRFNTHEPSVALEEKTLTQIYHVQVA
jgi:hypothetical protein